ncbi:MAG TPA: hypothetical protein VG498_07350, partial [Terriglobales bacterium]|nr:hypothetical protein [Terriglobales bacterium]
PHVSSMRRKQRDDGSAARLYAFGSSVTHSFFQEGSCVNKLVMVALIAGLWTLSGATARAQTTPSKGNTDHVISDRDLNLLRQDLRSKRKQLIAANLTLSDAEATKFWPVYDQYVTELIAINDKKFAVIQDYADNWGKLSDEQSLLFIRQWTDFDIQQAQLRQKYVPMVAKILDGKKTATFMQLDRRIAMMLELQVASQMPLVQDQER